MNVTVRNQRPLDDLADDFRDGAWSQSLLGGLVAGVVATSLGVSLAGLVFNGPLAGGFGTAVAASLLGGGIVAVVSALSSSSPGMVAGIQDAPVAIIAVAATAAAAVSDQPVATAFAVIVLATVGAGVALWTAGTYGLGRVLRFVPYPVLLGFVGATGLIVLVGAAKILVGPMSWAGALDANTLLVWIPGAVLAVGLLTASRTVGHPFVMPGAIVGSAVLVHLVRLANGATIQQAQGGGHLLGPFGDAGLFDPFIVRSLVDADWVAVAGQSAIIATAILVSVLSFLLNVPAIEELTGAEIDADADLPSVGIANVIVGLFGSLPAYVYLSDTVATARIAGLRRSSGVLAGLVGFGVVAAGPVVLDLIPTLVVGGVLAFIGLTFLFEALVDSRGALNAYEYGLILGMVAAAPLIGFGASIALGLVGAIGLFAVRYAAVDAIRVQADLVDYPSDVERQFADQQRLAAQRGTATVIDVDGFLFFGTAAHVGQRIVEAVAGDVRYLVLGLDGVSGMDGSVDRVFAKVAAGLAEEGKVLVVAGISLDAPLFRLLESAGVRHCHRLADGVRWVEDQLLGGNAAAAVPLDDFLRVHLFLDEPHIIDYFVREDVEVGSILIEEGQSAPGLIYLEQGEFAVTIAGIGGRRRQRIRVLNPGVVVGEVSWYDGSSATANVESTAAGVVWRLAAERFEQMEANEPLVAGAFHKFIARSLAGRVRESDRSLRVLLGDRR